MNHHFSDEEYLNIIENIRNQGFAEGMAEAKEEMGRVLDGIVESMNKSTPYRFPIWDTKTINMRGAAEPLDCDYPRSVELTREQLRAIRIWLCA